MPGITLKVCLICSSSSALSLPAGTFMRMRPGTWWATCNFIFVDIDALLSKCFSAVSQVHKCTGRRMRRPNACLISRFPRASGCRPVGRGVLGGLGFSLEFGQRVVDLFLGLGAHLARLLGDLVGAANRRLENRVQRSAELRQIFRGRDSGNAERQAREQGGFEQGGADGDHRNSSDRLVQATRFLLLMSGS